MMENDPYIELCLKRLAQIEMIVERMEKDGIDPDKSIWGVLEEKRKFWLSRIEAASQLDPNNWYQFTGDDYFWN
jgi:hypothetical protein